MRAAEIWGPAETSMLLHARGVEHHTKGVENCLSYINLVLATRHASASPAAATAPSPARATARADASTANGAINCRARAISKIRSIANSSRTSGASRNPSFRSTGLTACEIFDAIEPAKIKGLLSISFNPAGFDSRCQSHAGGAREAGILRLHRFLPFRNRRAMRTSSLPARCRKKTKAPSRPGKAAACGCSSPSRRRAMRAWTGRSSRTSRDRLGCKDYFPYAMPEDIFRELAAASKGGSADYSGMTYDKIEKNMGVFWPCPSFKHPGTPRLFEGGRVPSRRWQGAIPRLRIPAACRGRRRGVSDLLHDAAASFRNT